jgi:hypothetical protein
MTFNPPVHILKNDSRPRVNRLVDARAIAKRVSIFVHPDFIEEASRPTWHPFDLNAPVIKPFKTTIQSFASSEQESSLYRVIYCFSSYRKVHAALRSMVTLGSDDHEESQVPELWLESDYFFPTNFCSTCGDQSHTRSSCEEKGDATFCGFCGRQDHRTTHCPVKSSARTVFAALALKRLIATGYNEFTDFNPVLSAVVSHAEQVPATP